MLCSSLYYIPKWHALKKVSFALDKMVQVDELTINLATNCQAILNTKSVKVIANIVDGEYNAKEAILT